MRQAYHAESALKAEGLLTELARELGKIHPAGSGPDAARRPGPLPRPEAGAGAGPAARAARRS
jgi:hypothetical protein